MAKFRFARGLHLSGLSYLAVCMALPASGYEVKPGDTLSQIARRQIGPPIYGKQGSLRRLKGLNPHIRDENFIAPGQIIQTKVRSLALDQVWDQDKISQRTQVDGTQPVHAFSRKPAATLPGQPAHAAVLEISSASNAHAPMPLLLDATPLESNGVEDLPRFSQLSFEPKFSYLRLDSHDRANGTAAAFLSTLNVGARASWYQNWNSVWQSYIGAETKRVELQNPTTRTLVNGTRLYSGLSLGANYRTSTHATIGAELGVREEIFNRAVTEASLVLDPVAIPFGAITGSFDLITSSPYVFGVGAEATLFSSARTAFYDVSVGQGYRTNLYLNQLTGSTARPRLGVSLYFDYKKQNTSSIALTQKALGIDFSYFWGVAP